MSDLKEPIPNLVKPDGSRVAIGSTITREELLDAIKLVVGHQASAEAMAAKMASEIAAIAVRDALNKVDDPALRKGEWNVHNFPAISAYNPVGDHARPRPEITGDVWWNGQYVRHLDHTYDECVLFNQLRPGLFHAGQWLVKDLAPGVPGKRMLLVLFPCKDPDQRVGLPSLVDMLRELTAQTATPALVA